jgi:hypothetical protein
MTFNYKENVFRFSIVQKMFFIFQLCRRWVLFSIVLFIIDLDFLPKKGLLQQCDFCFTLATARLRYCLISFAMGFTLALEK